MSENIGISIQRLSKHYGNSDKFALRNLSLQVKYGEVYGFLGPNGAGKSTTIRILMNFLRPSSGTATIHGHDIVKDSVSIKQLVGYLSGDFAAYPKMTGGQFLQYLAELQGDNSHGNALLLAKRLNADLNKHMGDLSRGNRQKIGLIQAMMHEPKVLILDEPTSGLDPLMQEEFYKLINEAKARGAAVFVSSHILSEVQKMCDRVGIIREGELVAERNIEEMAHAAAHTLEIRFANAPPIAELKKVRGLRMTSHNEKHVVINLQGNLSDLFAVLAKHNVQAIDTRSLDLEEMFIHFYKNERDQL